MHTKKKLKYVENETRTPEAIGGELKYLLSKPTHVMEGRGRRRGRRRKEGRGRRLV